LPAHFTDLLPDGQVNKSYPFAGNFKTVKAKILKKIIDSSIKKSKIIFLTTKGLKYAKKNINILKQNKHIFTM
jgi:hypothetical protein